MKQGDRLHGFQLKYSQPLPEIGATLHRFTYVKNGADLIWLERPDENKTFSISFKTVPRDDTGVFHILEHSVLCGSEKYPVKEPFVDLIKGSLATFINAMTFPDKTMYPISSRNDKDFLNLMDVYLDAALHPLSAKDPHAYRQEGWHYELDAPEGELTVNGVVYNEMKGAYTSPESVMENALLRQLFPDTCYGCESGGHPDHIPELTYESYLANYRRFYHPSNAYIFLDGAVDLDAALRKLDQFLKPYDRIDPDADISLQKPVQPPEATACYPISPEEDEAGKAWLARGWVCGTFLDQEKGVALQVLTEALAGSNDAPLKKALLDAGLCEDVLLDWQGEVQQPYVQMIIKNADPARKEEIWALVDKVLRQQAEGLDRKRLSGVLSRQEFIAREKDFGGMPLGLVYAVFSMTAWLYGGDPAQYLCGDAVYSALREKIGSGSFEALLREALLDNPHHASVTLLPSKTIAEEKRAALAARLAKIKAGWDEKTVNAVIADFRALREKQDREDTPEQKATLPRLALSDIPEKRTLIPQETLDRGGVRVLRQPQETGGITYLNLYFDLKDLSLEEMSQAALLCPLLGAVATEHLDAAALRSEINEKIGRLRVRPWACAGKNGAKAYITVKAAMLDSKKMDAAALLLDILNHSTFQDSAFVLNLIRQTRIDLEEHVMMAGNAFAAMHAGAGLSVRGAMEESMQGIGFLRTVQRTEKEFGPETLADLQRLAAKVFSRSRVTVSLTGDRDEAFVDSVIGGLRDTPVGPAADIQPLENGNTGIVISSEIGFAARVARLAADDLGTADVASHFLTYDYLWNTVRVKGGAYGTGFRVRRDGEMKITSYRDPSAAQSLSAFCQTGQALRDFCRGEEDLEKYVISTIGDIDPLLTPRMAGETAAEWTLCGVSGDDLLREWDQVLHTDKAKLAAFADALDRACQASVACVVGSQNALDACGDTIRRVEALQASSC